MAAAAHTITRYTYYFNVYKYHNKIPIIPQKKNTLLSRTNVNGNENDETELLKSVATCDASNIALLPPHLDWWSRSIL